jgi:hypothetical protein
MPKLALPIVWSIFTSARVAIQCFYSTEVITAPYFRANRLLLNVMPGECQIPAANGIRDLPSFFQDLTVIAVLNRFSAADH